MADILLQGPVNYDALWARPQIVARHLSENHRVLYVDPPYNVWRGMRPAPGLRQVDERLWRFTPAPSLPRAGKFPVINRYNQRKLGRELQPTLRRLGFTRPWVLTYLPQTADLLPLINRAGLIYDCVDVHSHFPGVTPAVMDGYERRVLSLADVVFVSAGNLLARVEKWFKGAHLIPNACNYSHFAGAKQLSEPGGLRGMPHPRVLFVGGIYGWLDIDLITKAAKELSDWAFVFVGPGGDDRLVRVPNITLLGPKPYAELPNYYGHTDAAIIPFALSDLTRGVNPIKVYEYLAAGLPVVATPLPELTAIASEIELASGVNEFVEALRRTQTVDVTSRVANRQAIARQNDWAERFKEMDRVLAPYLHEED